MQYVWDQAQTQMVEFLRSVTMAAMLESPHHDRQKPITIQTDG